MKRRFAHATIVACLVIAPVFAVQDTPPAIPSLADSLREFENGDSLNVDKAESNMVLSMLKVESRLCEIVRKYVESPKPPDGEHRRVVSALDFLSRFGRAETINLLCEHVAFQDSVALGGRERPQVPEHAYICMEALIHMDGRALPAFAKLIATTESAKIRQLAIIGIVYNCYQMNRTERRSEHDEKAGERLAKAYLREVAASTPDTNERARLLKACDLVDDALSTWP